MSRYIALDAFRGLTIALMILVNTPGSWDFVYWPLMHANWHGVTPTDLVFPFFLFIIGSAMFFSFRKTSFALTPQQLIRVIKRGGIIFLLGLFLNAYPFVTPLENLRVMGVLQRIGIAYILASCVVLLCSKRQIWAFCSVLLVGYWLLLLTAPNAPFSLESNLVRSFDLAILGAGHMWQVGDLAFDPEGLLSTLPSVVSVLLGFEITRMITAIDNKKDCVIKLIKVASALLFVSLLWQLVLPLNKQLWTSSYVIFSTAMACLLLALFVYLIDIRKGEQRLASLLVYGTNPLFIYVFSWLWTTTYLHISVGEIDLHQWLFNILALVFEPYLASLIFALAHVILFWLVSLWLYQRRIFVKI